jgi:hypothetical protein
MKKILIALALTASTSATTVFAAVLAVPLKSTPDAQTSLQQLPVTERTSTLTRAEVRQELVRAQKDGELAALRATYSGH